MRKTNAIILKCPSRLIWILILFTFCLSTCIEKHSTQIVKIAKPIEATVVVKKIKKDSSITQECYYKDLSYRFDYKIRFKRIYDIDEDHNDSCFIQVYIIEKSTLKLMDSIKYIPNEPYRSVFENCVNLRSYITGKNKNKEILDADYGDFIIIDLNFDSKEDIAIQNNSSVDNGPYYCYFIQGDDKKYHIDRFLTDSMGFFPTYIRRKSKILETYGIAGGCGIGINKYKYNSISKDWKHLSYRVINHCK